MLTPYNCMDKSSISMELTKLQLLFSFESNFTYNLTMTTPDGYINEFESFSNWTITEYEREEVTMKSLCLEIVNQLNYHRFFYIQGI